MEILDHLTLSFEWPNGIHVNFEANQITPRGFSKVGEEFTGTTGSIHTSRTKMIHIKAPNDVETMESKADITIDALQIFIGRVLSGDIENVGERSALSTMIALLGRAALYSGKEATWKGEFGA
jgi:hypothetical protein